MMSISVSKAVVLASLNACLLQLVALQSAAAEASLRRGLVASFPLAEGEGQVVGDRSDNEHRGEIYGPLWVKSKEAAALDFDGSREWVDCGDETATRLAGPLTVSVWICPLTTASQNIVSRGDWSLGTDPAGNAAFTARPANTRAWDATQTILSDRAIPPNQWTHLAAVYDTKSEEMQIYIDGKLAASAAKSDGAVGGHFRSKLLIGGNGYSGLIAGVRLYDRALA
jgi:hypothetical protein